MQTHGTVEVALSGASTTFLLQAKAASGHQARLLEMGISFRNGESVTAQAVLVELLRTTTDGTASALTAVKLDDDSDAIAVSWTKTFTVDPTSGDVMHDFFVSPAPGGGHIWRPPKDLKIPGGGRIAMKATTQSGVIVTCRAYMILEE